MQVPDATYTRMINELKTLLIIAQLMTSKGTKKNDICWETGVVPSLTEVIRLAEEAKNAGRANTWPSDICTMDIQR